ncbi:MFS general substrate transporter [Cadophora sp. DSE1049]|nr:MFS general substrate transporter [Cadophora sp. DSE1049]
MFASTGGMATPRSTVDFDVEKEPETPISGAATVVAPSYPPSITNNDHIQHPTSLPREAAFVAILCMAQLFTQASLGQAIAPLHIIGSSFGVASQPGQLSWFPAAYSLTVGTFILIAGRLGDLYGHKRFLIAGWIWYGVWSLLAGFAVYVRHSPVFFDVCRGMQGIGPAFLLPNALAILGRTYEQGRRKEMVFSIFGATAPSGFVLGAVFASLFAQVAWWPWAFWAMGILCFGMGVAGYFAIPQSPPPVIDREDGIGMWERVDGWGCLTGVSALVLINFAWNQGPVVGWDTPYTYVLLIVGFVFLAVFAWVESRASHPLLPMEALTKDTAFVLGCMAAGWSSFGIWVFYSWQFLEELRHTTPLLASAQFIPCAFSGLAAALTTGHILHRVGPSIVMMIAMTAFTTGLILIATAPINQTYWAQTFISICIMPWGMDMSFPAATILLSDHMRKEHQGVAASLVNTVINYSVSIGLGFAGTIESRVNKGGEDLLGGYRGAWYMGIGLAGLGICVSVGFGGSQLRERRRRRLRRSKGVAE